MESISRLELARYRLELAKNKLQSAELLLDQSHYADAASRAYYALLHGARALLATKGLDSKKHSGVISLFNRHFVKTGIVPKGLGKLLLNAKDIREESDYNEFYVVSKQDTVDLVEQAKDFLEIIAKLIETDGTDV